MEAGTRAGPRFDPDTSPVPLDDLLAQRQADARPWICFAGVQPLENDEDALGVARIDADAVVGDGEQILRTAALGAHAHDRWRFAAELHRVANQILEDLAQLRWIAEHGRQRTNVDRGMRLGDRHAQIDEYLLHQRVAL